MLKEGNLGETLSALRTLTALLRPQPEPVRKAFRALLDELRLDDDPRPELLQDDDETR